jgi:catalase
MADPSTQQRFGNQVPVRGLMLLQDTQLIETLAHFARERIPERMVHASAVGAWGELEVTHDNSWLTSAKYLNGIGKKSKVLWRLSTVGPERGSSETVRDVRGWGMKVFTEEGNQDFVFNDIVSGTLESVSDTLSLSFLSVTPSSSPPSIARTNGFLTGTCPVRLWQVLIRGSL